MENEGSKSATQNYQAEHNNHEETIKSSRKKYESNSTLLTRAMTKKRNKQRSSQDMAQKAKNISNSSSFLGAVSLCYPERKSLLKRFKDCSLSPCSDEYKFVMQGFKEVDEQPTKSTIAAPKQSKKRTTSFSNFARGTQNSSSKITTEFERDFLPFRPRPRGNTVPSRLSEVRPPLETQLGGKDKAVDKMLDVAFSSKVKLAWQDTNSDLNFPKKKEKRRHVSLCCPPQRENFVIKREENKKKLSETSPQRELKGNWKEMRRKKAEIELPMIKERAFIDGLQIERSDANISDGEKGKISAAEQMDAGHSALDGSTKDLPRGENWLGPHPQSHRSDSSGHFTESKDTATTKQKLSHSLSSPATGHYKSPEISLSPVFNLRDTDAKFETFSDKSTIRRTDQFSITRASLGRVGTATLAATRLLKIHYRENGVKDAPTITQKEKELDKLFEEMEHCRYLRKKSSEMRT